MAEVGSAFVSILPSAKGFRSKLDSEVGGQIEASGKKAGSRFGAALKMGAAAGGVLVAGMLRSAVAGAGDLQQSVGAIDTVFGRSSGRMHTWAKGAATDVGLTRNEFNELGTLIGSQLKNGGTAMDKLAPKTRNLIKTGADLSSMFGGTTKEAVEALSSALKGERDPIERYGVSLNQAKIDSEAAALGFKKVDGALSSQAQQAATLSLIMKQTSAAQGNFARESGTLAHQQQVLGARLGNLKDTIGTALLPVMTSATAKVSTFVGQMQSGTGAGGRLVAVLTSVKNNLGTIGPTLAVVAAGLTIYKVASLAAAAATAIQAAGTSAATGATWSLNAALRANPIGIVVTLLTALAAGMVIAYKKSSTFRGIVNAVGAALGSAIGWLGRGVGAVVNFGASVIRGASQVDEFAGRVRDKVGDAIGFISDIPDRAASALGNLGSTLYNAGAELIQGLIDGIQSKIDNVTGAMGSLASTIRGFLPGSPVKTGPLRSWNRGGAGRRLVGLLVDGLDDSGPALRSASERMAASLRDPSVQLRTSGGEGAFAVAGSAAAGGLSKKDVAAIAAAVREGAYAGTSGRVEAQGMRRRAGGKA